MLEQPALDLVAPQGVYVAAESARRTRRAYEILEYKIPADHERHEFANRHVNVDVCWAAARDACAQLCIS